MTKDWAMARSLMTPEVIRTFLDDLRYTDLVCGYYVGAPLPALAAINDFSLWFFVWDDLHDRHIACRRADDWARLRDNLHAALDHPGQHLTHPDHLVSAFSDCLMRLFQPMSSAWKARFNAHFHATIDAYDQEYLNRTTGTIPTVEQYLRLRRHTFGMGVWIDCLELAAKCELPRDIRDSSPYRNAGLASQEFAAWYNDLCSMPKEWAAGDFHNLGIVLAHESNLPMRAAAQRLACLLRGRIDDFRRGEVAVCRQLDDISADAQLRSGVRHCLGNMRNWISSVYWFHAESVRYQVASWPDQRLPPYVNPAR